MNLFKYVNIWAGSTTPIHELLKSINTWTGSPTPIHELFIYTNRWTYSRYQHMNRFKYTNTWTEVSQRMNRFSYTNTWTVHVHHQLTKVFSSINITGSTAPIPELLKCINTWTGSPTPIHELFKYTNQWTYSRYQHMNRFSYTNTWTVQVHQPTNRLKCINTWSCSIFTTIRIGSGTPTRAGSITTYELVQVHRHTRLFKYITWADSYASRYGPVLVHENMSTYEPVLVEEHMDLLKCLFKHTKTVDSHTEPINRFPGCCAEIFTEMHHAQAKTLLACVRGGGGALSGFRSYLHSL
jgi:hypothetical protein